MKNPQRSAIVHAVVVAASMAATTAHANEVNLYTTREPGLVQPLLEAFTAETGVKVNTVFVKDGLGERVAAEGARSPADVLMAVDFGNLVDLVDRKVVQPVRSPILEAAIPANLRDAYGRWFSLSMRARVLYASKDRTDIAAFTYEDLTKPEWKSRICMRSAQHPYNTALIAGHIAHHGEAATEEWLRGVKANLARKPGGGDRDVARDILGGICDIGIANSYYVGRMRSGDGGPEQKEWADAITVVLPTFAGHGTAVNVSGAAVAAHAPNRDNAVKLLEYLVSDAAQAIYAKANYEYPIKAGSAVDPIIASFGNLRQDDIDLSVISTHRKAASLIADKVGFDN